MMPLSQMQGDGVLANEMLSLKQSRSHGLDSVARMVPTASSAK